MWTLRLIQLSDFLGSVLGAKVYPLEFPHNNDENLLVLDIINGDFQGDMRVQNIQLMNRSTHPGIGEEFANNVISTLHNLTNKIWEDCQVVLIQANNPNPFFAGNDENERYLYTVDFRVLTTKE